MKLISEDIQDIQLVTEETGGKKNLFIEGVFMMFGEKNQNGRIYPEKVMDKAVSEYVKNYIETSRALGELNHPPQPTVNPERAAVLTTGLWKEDKFYKGKAKVLSTPMGKIVESLLNDGVKLGVSTRGVGSIKKENGSSVVQGDFMLTAAIDVVADPSVKYAFVEGIYEDKSWECVKGILVQCPERIEEEVKKALSVKKHKRDKAMLEAWTKIMEELSK